MNTPLSLNSTFSEQLMAQNLDFGRLLTDGCFIKLIKCMLQPLPIMKCSVSQNGNVRPTVAGDAAQTYHDLYCGAFVANSNPFIS